jgi:hypothetical protein
MKMNQEITNQSTNDLDNNNNKLNQPIRTNS